MLNNAMTDKKDFKERLFDKEERVEMKIIAFLLLFVAVVAVWFINMAFEID